MTCTTNTHPTRTLFVALAMALGAATLTACHSDNDDLPQPTASHTLLMYMPWSGDSSPLTDFFWQNISGMKKAYNSAKADGSRVVVLISTSGSDAYMFDLDDFCGSDDASLTRYRHISSPSLTTAEGIAQLLGDMKAMAPANNYAMTIGCHGMGWLPVSTTTTKRVGGQGCVETFVPYWQHATDGGLITRYFGGTSTKYQVETATFAEAIERTGTKMDFILFDDCYMSSVEAAYDLRHVAGHIIACPTEVMGEGMPYATIGTQLLGTPDYEAVCQGFVKYYSSSSSPYGTIGVTDCSELDSLASIMRRINAVYTLDPAKRGSIQRMDGYSPTIFHDFGDYVAHLCADSALLAQFKEQLNRAVPYKGHTGKYPCMGSNPQPIDNNAYSGITTSDASINTMVTTTRESTAWYEATH